MTDIQRLRKFLSESRAIGNTDRRAALECLGRIEAEQDRLSSVRDGELFASLATENVRVQSL